MTREGVSQVLRAFWGIIGVVGGLAMVDFSWPRIDGLDHVMFWAGEACLIWGTAIIMFAVNQARR